MRALISRIVAVPIAALVAWLVSIGLDVGPEFTTAMTEAATLLLMAVFTLAYGVAHKLIDKRVHPTDSAVSGPATFRAAEYYTHGRKP